MRRSIVLLSLGAAAVLTFPVLVPVASASQNEASRLFYCADNGPLCAEPAEPLNYEGNYIGHDEPSLLFYSNTPGAGNNQQYRITLPTEPPTQPLQDGSGGTFNFQLHPAFWFGMALCDDQSAPNPGGSALAGATIPCTPDSDANIFTSTNPADPKYIGKHPGTAFLELQFYPPGWVQQPVGFSCDPQRWCAAMAIFSLNQNQNTGEVNNTDCLNRVGVEPANYAFITKSGIPTDRTDPLGINFRVDASKDLMMHGGDVIVTDIHDTSAGLQIVLHDLTTGQSGSMTASAANGFKAVNFDPAASTCTETPWDFHPMYSTSSEDTRVVWAAHSYNVAASDEIGHFEYCNAVDGQGGNCTQAGANDPDGLDSDDTFCFAPPFQRPFNGTKVKVGGCLATDGDFDGVSYQTTWPGTLSNAAQDAAIHPAPFRFTSPVFNGTRNYERIAFEADLPRIEVPAISPNNNCNRSTGAGCVNPPNGASFYPIYSTTTIGGQCVWQFGGPLIPGTTNRFGGTSTAEYGPLLLSDYPGVGGPITRYNNFRNVLSSNPCPG
ncbi:MAG TPA: hypothetical protein VGJ63_07340 [Micromonosporaceae bacterium]